MKKISILVLVLSAAFTNAQAYKGKGDAKFSVGFNTQGQGTGLNVMTDFGSGENISFGISATYLMNTVVINNQKPKFEDRADIKARFNANLGNVFKLNPKMDIYPGLDLGTRNFGGHLGFRYFLSNGFGIYTEAGVPFSRYDMQPTDFQFYNNQFYFNIGACFNL